MVPPLVSIEPIGSPERRAMWRPGLRIVTGNNKLASRKPLRRGAQPQYVAGHNKLVTDRHAAPTGVADRSRPPLDRYAETPQQASCGKRSRHPDRAAPSGRSPPKGPVVMRRGILALAAVLLAAGGLAGCGN